MLWNPWRGCFKCSEGCKFCYIHKGDKKRNVNTNDIVKTASFDLPLRKDKSGNYKIKSGTLVYLCFSSDFLLAEADIWRDECWKMIKERNDLTFLFLTKRIHRFNNCIPDDWGSGYSNVVVGCSVENQKNVDEKISILVNSNIHHKIIVCQPLIEEVNLEKYLDHVNQVVVGGESDYRGRSMRYEWILSIREQCIKHQTNFEFRQCSTHFIKDNKKYLIKTRDLMKQARKANINLSF